MLTISYNGVHQAYQLALAAQEVRLLDEFLCSFYDAPGKWGRRLRRVMGPAVMKNRSLEGIDPARVVEHPWPELRFKLRGRLRKLPPNAWIKAARPFDKWAAQHLARSASRGVVCSENCAYATFQVAAKRGLRRIYDCPGHNAEQLRANTEEAARRTGLHVVTVADTPEVTRRKEVEIGLAEKILTYSDSHTAGVVARGVEPERIHQIPLWTDPAFWVPPATPRERLGPLRVLFAGGINLRKGVPFLLDAVRAVAPHAKLTLVGSLDPNLRPCLAGTESFATLIGPVAKQDLRTLYQAHDVLVLPSLGDSFGFVALEAMACGLPVILTTHCGAPVPDPQWRVPIMDAAAIAQALTRYLDKPAALATDSLRAREFAVGFTPKRYRDAIGGILSRLDP
jgi:glycosyltransferase involved in cell wall biosynthesis